MKFDEWFNDQFKTEPNPEKSLIDMSDEEDMLISRLSMVRTMIRDREKWMDCRNAAMYAWNIKDKDKK